MPAGGAEGGQRTYEEAAVATQMSCMDGPRPWGAEQRCGVWTPGAEEPGMEGGASRQRIEVRVSRSKVGRWLSCRA